MGLLRSFIKHMEQQETGDTEDILEKLLKQQKLIKLLQQSKLAEQPIYGAEIAKMPAYDPAQSVLKPPPGMVGPTYGEAGAFAEIMKNLPISELISQKAGPEMWGPYARFLGPPETFRKMVSGTMYPTEKTRTWEQYLPKFLELLELTKKPRRRPQAERAPGFPPAEIGEEEEERVPTEIDKVRDIAQMLVDELRRTYGTLEKEKIPEVKPLKWEEGLYRGAEILREPKPPTEKPLTGIIAEFKEWQKDPKNFGKTWTQFYAWRQTVGKEKAGEMTIQQISQELRMWMGLKKSLKDRSQLEIMLRALDKELPKGEPKPEDVDELTRQVDEQIQYWRSELEAKKIKPGGRADVLNLRGEIDRILKERE